MDSQARCRWIACGRSLREAAQCIDDESGNFRCA